MRLFLTTCLLALASIISLAQSTGQRAKSAIYSASSGWQKVTLKSPTRLASTRSVSSSPANVVSPSITHIDDLMEPASVGPSPSASGDFRPAFMADFATNRNGWKAGNRGDYHYQIGEGRYSIRKRNTNTSQLAFSTVELPIDINLNRTDLFTIKVDVLADSGQVPTGGVLFGVRDSLNFCAFTLNMKGEASILRVINGRTSSEYMPGDYFSPAVSVEKNRNRLTVQRKGDALHFYINNQEIRTSPYRFKVFPGNGVGFMASGYWTSFQKLSVTLGL